MKRRHFMSVLLSQSGVGAAIIAATGCGTLMHPERRHQGHSNQIDWKIAACNGLGLLLFFVPGVIAFAVDFYTGAIYLPAGHGHADNSDSPASRLAVTRFGLHKITIPRDQLSLHAIEQAVSKHVGQTVVLDEDSRVSELAQIERFDTQLSHHKSDQRFGHSLRKFLRV
jgi:hypothetical protein